MATQLTVILGFGKTGQSMLRYCCARQWPVAVCDTRADLDVTHWRQQYPQVPIILGAFDHKLLKQASQILISPGVALSHPALAEPIASGVPVYGDIELFAKEASAPIVAITGSNGKSTVTTLVGEMFTKFGMNARVGGNLGTPALDLLTAQSVDVYVLELSSFQLEVTSSLRAKVATILNISADHLDRHNNMDSYLAAKQRIYRQAEIAVCNDDDKQTWPRPMHNEQRIVTFSSQYPHNDGWGIKQRQDELWLAHGDDLILSVASLALLGNHNWSNALAAMAIVNLFGVSYEAMVAVLTNFSGLAHRTQLVMEHDGISWVNDSKATNVGAMLAAINGFAEQGRKIVLIAGGDSKGVEFSAIHEAVAKHVRALIVLGKDAKQIAQSCSGLTVIKSVPSIEAAVHTAHSLATSNDVVLLSPGCASTDMFPNYMARGDCFINCLADSFGTPAVQQRVYHD